MKPNFNSKTTFKEENGHWVVSTGSASVKIYKSDSRGSALFTVVYYLAGQRKRDVRTTLESAKTHAETIVQDLARGDAAVKPLSVEERLEFVRAEAVLEESGLSVDAAAFELADARKRLQGRAIGLAVEYFLRHNPSADLSMNVRDVVDQFLLAKRADGRGFRHLKDLTLRLDKFCEAFSCPISSVTTEQINTWLRGLKCTGRSRNNYRNAVRNLFGYAGARKFISAEQISWDADSGVALAKEEQQPIEIFTPEELSKLIAAARVNPDDLPNGFNRRYAQAQGLLPLLVLGAFAGLRTAEICGQAWEDINLERGFLRVTMAKGNTPARRLVPISENLKKWLLLCKRDSGVCCDHKRPEDPIRRLAERAKVPWKHNALRHSFISYRVAQTQNIPQVAIESGNSPQMINRHYRELVSPEEAATWFAIGPDAASNVVPFKKVA